MGVGGGFFVPGAQSRYDYYKKPRYFVGIPGYFVGGDNIFCR